MKKIISILSIILILFVSVCSAEEILEKAYIICMPNDRVNIRMGPSRSSCSIGWCEAGDVVYVDGKSRNGFLHCVGLGIEDGEGWIHKGYIIYEQP